MSVNRMNWKPGVLPKTIATSPLPQSQPEGSKANGTDESTSALPYLSDVDSTLSKSLSELEQAQLRAARIEPVNKRNTGRGTQILEDSKRTTADVLSLTADARGAAFVPQYNPRPDPNTHSNPASGLFCWRIELYGLGPGNQPMGFDILDDAVLGRGRTADIDFDPYLAAERGVSRRHALLRPTALRLFLIDLGSVNGTCINSVWLGHAATRTVEDNDVIALGAFSFALKIVDSPFEAARRLEDRA